MWHNTNNQLYRALAFRDFNQAFAFLTELAALCAAVQHHPRWQQDSNKVEIWLTTHDAGNKITVLDYRMAQQIDLLAGKYYLVSS